MNFDSSELHATNTILHEEKTLGCNHRAVTTATRPMLQSGSLDIVFKPLMGGRTQRVLFYSTLGTHSCKTLSLWLCHRTGRSRNTECSLSATHKCDGGAIKISFLLQTTSPREKLPYLAIDDVSEWFAFEGTGLALSSLGMRFEEIPSSRFLGPLAENGRAGAKTIYHNVALHFYATQEKRFSGLEKWLSVLRMFIIVSCWMWCFRLCSLLFSCRNRCRKDRIFRCNLLPRVFKLPPPKVCREWPQSESNTMRRAINGICSMRIKRWKAALHQCEECSVLWCTWRRFIGYRSGWCCL